MNKVSIIIANYNNAQYLPKCFDSILSQTYMDIEIVVVDDCSTDNSREIIQSYDSKYPGLLKSVFLPENEGVAKARHEGILKSTGEFITTLDADDYYLNELKLEKEFELINHFKNNFNKEIIAFSDIVIVDKDGKRIEEKRNTPFQGDLIKLLMTRNGFIPRDMLIFRNMYFDVGGYDYSFVTHEDWDLKIRLALKYEFYFTGIEGTAYRRHGQGLSASSLELRLRNLDAVFEKNISTILDEGLKHEIRVGFESFMQRKRSELYWK